MMKKRKDIQFRRPKVCCISDIHIGIHQNSPQWHQIAIEWAKWLRDELKKQDIADIVMCGDLIHHRAEVDIGTLNVVVEVLKIWDDFNIIMLVGNHDCYFKQRTDVNSLEVFNEWSNITVISEVTSCEYLNNTYTFCPWATSLEDIPESHIVFGHFEIQNFKYNQYRINVHGFKYTDLVKRTDLVITGHFHMGEVREYESGTIVYLGNPFQMDFGDTDSLKGYYLLDLRNKEFDFYPNTISPQYRKISLSRLVKIGKITDKVAKFFKNNIVKLVVDMSISAEHIDTLLEKLKRLNPMDLTVDYVVNFSRFMSSADDADLSGVDTEVAIKEFVNLLDIKNKDTIIKYTIDLYNKAKE